MQLTAQQVGWLNSPNPSDNALLLQSLGGDEVLLHKLANMFGPGGQYYDPKNYGFQSGAQEITGKSPEALAYMLANGQAEKGADGKSRQIAAYPAMLALIQAPDGQAVTLHRTYLCDGRKLDATDAKKVLSAGIHGAAVRLFDAGAQLALCEGIETALAVHLATGKPVWAGISAGNLEKLWVPDTVREVCIYADNDAGGDFAGQCFAYALARRLKREERTTGPRQVRVFVPRHAGTDWADVWCQRATGPDQGRGQATASSSARTSTRTSRRTR